MNGDPERLLSVNGDADSLERELLESVRHVGPPGGAKDEAWRRLATQLAVVTAVGTAASSTASAASKAGVSTLTGWALTAKIAVVALGGGIALGGGYLLSSRANAPTELAPPSAASQNPPTAASAVAPRPQDSSPAVPSREDASPSPKLGPRRLDSLKAESALLMQARSELRAGNPGAAQASLERLHAQFPKGMLAQEREVLAVEVLHARGNVDGAKRRARAFMMAYPKSPHSQKLARFVE